MKEVSIILPAMNEVPALRELLPDLKKQYPKAEIIVIDDGSTDDTIAVVKESGITLISHPYTMGNGASIKSGARAASGEILVFMDADGQHNPSDIHKLVKKLDEGFDMAIGARSSNSHSSLSRWIANSAYNKLASLMTGFKILDLTSGFRAVRAKKFRRFLYLLPNGFSYPATSTMAFFRSGYPVAYVPIGVVKRLGKSNIRLLHDGLRFFVIIMKIGTLFSPMRLFLPISFMTFAAGIFYYGYTYLNYGRFTNMSALLFISSLLIFLIGIVSEQVSSLHYKSHHDDGNAE